uniref:Uncharacterized protein n=1 Tax=Norrisiella sphaerica TaxID=552664 RepID=A0A7S2QRW5_9EUKA|mmetsp:Transcript_1257/g.1753  ORF Transcript_1257/g.1753 Transcript_1257/m.1753 type:complete len:260 (+) Transcript_1257:80-859(+)
MRRKAVKVPEETHDHRGFRLYPEETLRAQHITMPYEWHQHVPHRRYPGKNWLNKGTPEAPGVFINITHPDQNTEIFSFMRELHKLWFEEGGVVGIFPGILREYRDWRTERIAKESREIQKKGLKPTPGFRALRDAMDGLEIGVDTGKEARDTRRVLRELGGSLAEAAGDIRSSEIESELSGAEEEVDKLLLTAANEKTTMQLKHDDDDIYDKDDERAAQLETPVDDGIQQTSKLPLQEEGMVVEPSLFKVGAEVGKGCV